jgi:hypothetical protein
MTDIAPPPAEPAVDILRRALVVLYHELARASAAAAERGVSAEALSEYLAVRTARLRPDRLGPTVDQHGPYRRTMRACSTGSATSDTGPA